MRRSLMSHGVGCCAIACYGSFLAALFVQGSGWQSWSTYSPGLLLLFWLLLGLIFSIGVLTMLISQFDVFDKPDNAKPPSIYWTQSNPTTAYSSDKGLKLLAPGSIVIHVDQLGDNNCADCDVLGVYVKLFPTPDGAYDGGADYRPLYDNVHWDTTAPVSSAVTYRRMPLGSIAMVDTDDDDVAESAFIKVTDTGTDDWIAFPLDDVSAGVTGLLGGAGVSDQQLKDWTESGSYEMTAITYHGTYTNTISSATAKWPDGSSGTFTATSINATWEAIDAFTITHALSAKTVTQAAVTRNASGNVTTKPALTVA